MEEASFVKRNFGHKIAHKTQRPTKKRLNSANRWSIESTNRTRREINDHNHNNNNNYTELQRVFTRHGSNLRQLYAQQFCTTSFVVVEASTWFSSSSSDTSWSPTFQSSSPYFEAHPRKWTPKFKYDDLDGSIDSFYTMDVIKAVVVVEARAEKSIWASENQLSTSVCTFGRAVVIEHLWSPAELATKQRQSSRDTPPITCLTPRLNSRKMFYLWENENSTSEECRYSTRPQENQAVGLLACFAMLAPCSKRKNWPQIWNHHMRTCFLFSISPWSRCMW